MTGTEEKNFEKVNTLNIKIFLQKVLTISQAGYILQINVLIIKIFEYQIKWRI